MRNKRFDMVSLVENIGLSRSCLSFLGKPKSVDVLKKEIENFKELVGQQRRWLAVQHHPDKGGDAERMKEINDICDLLCKLEVAPSPPPRPRPHPGHWSFHFSFTRVSRGGWGTHTTTDSTS